MSRIAAVRATSTTQSDTAALTDDEAGARAIALVRLMYLRAHTTDAQLQKEIDAFIDEKVGGKALVEGAETSYFMAHLAADKELLDQFKFLIEQPPIDTSEVDQVKRELEKGRRNQPHLPRDR